MLKNLFILLMTIVFVLGALAYARSEEGSEGEGGDEYEPTAVATCQELQEKVNILLPLQEVVKRDFARVTDPYLCKSMAGQCEYFYSLTKYFQKQYRKNCDSEYEVVKIDECDYSENPCVKEFKQRPASRSASAMQERRAFSTPL